MPNNNDDEACTAVYLPSHLREELKEWLDKQHNYRLVTPNSIDDQRPHARRSESPKSTRRSSKAGSASRQHHGSDRTPSESTPQRGKKPPWQLPGRHSTRSPDASGPRPSSASSRRSNNDIHERLYRQGMDSVTKREEEARAARVARRKKEDVELRRSKALERLSLVCVGAKEMTPQKRAEELAKFEKEAPPRIDKATEATMVVRLGQRRTSSQGSARSHVRKEETFHPKTIDSRLKGLSSGELDEHFQALYQDSHKRTRRAEELGARLAHQRKTRLVEERLASDIIFRRQVKSNPSLKDKYFDICE